MTKPALTPEEWKFLLYADSYDHPLAGPNCEHVPEDICIWSGEHVLEIDHEMPRQPHQVAAFLLHGQPFGFTWADVDLLRDADFHPARLRDGDACDNIADRIAALLPPRDIK